MDTVVLDGVSYVKASVAAKSFRYTSDYLGQLCRAKKIDARLVGRTWFVNPESIREHKNNKFKAPEESAPRTDIPQEIKVSRKEVHSVSSGKSIKVISDASANDNLSRKLRVYYDIDDEALIPSLIKKPVRPPKNIRVELVNAKKVRITGPRSVHASFKAEELPDVALSGKLSVTTYEDENEEELVEEKIEPVIQLEKSDIKPNNKDISAKQDSVQEKTSEAAAIKTESGPDTFAVKLNKLNSPTTAPAKVSLTPENNPQKVNVLKSALKAPLSPIPSPLQEISFKPLSASTAQATATTATAKKTPTIILVSPLIATTLAIIFAGLVFSASQTIVVSSSFYQSEVTFQIANLLEVLQN